MYNTEDAASTRKRVLHSTEILVNGHQSYKKNRAPLHMSLEVNVKIFLSHMT